LPYVNVGLLGWFRQEEGSMRRTIDPFGGERGKAGSAPTEMTVIRYERNNGLGLDLSCVF